MQRLNDPANGKPIDILDALKSGRIVWVYAFPTMGKTTFQRVLRFLPFDKRKAIGLDTVVDASDTDEWLATFKMGDNTERKEDIYNCVISSMKLADSLKSHHPRLVVTNMWHCLMDAGVEPTAIILPYSASLVRDRVIKRGDDHPERIADNADEWLANVIHSSWTVDRADRVIMLNEGEFVASALTIGGFSLADLTFDRDGAVRSKTSPSPVEDEKATAVSLGGKDPDAEEADELVLAAVDASEDAESSFDSDENPDETGFVGSY